MLRVSISLASLALVLTACSSSPKKAAYEQEDFTQNQTYSRSYSANYKVACDAGRRALLSQGYSIDKSTGDMVSGHKNFIDQDGRNTQITFNVNCAPDSMGPDNSQVFANAIQDSFSLKKSTTAASVGVSILGSVSLPFMSSDDALVKTSSVTVTRPQFYGGFFDLLQQYLAVAQLEQPVEPSKTTAPIHHTPAPVVTPTVPLTPDNTGIAKPPSEPVAPASESKTAPAAPAATAPAAASPSPTNAASGQASKPVATTAPASPAAPGTAPAAVTTTPGSAPTPATGDSVAAPANTPSTASPPQ